MVVGTAGGSAAATVQLEGQGDGGEFLLRDVTPASGRGRCQCGIPSERRRGEGLSVFFGPIRWKSGVMVGWPDV